MVNATTAIKAHTKTQSAAAALCVCGVWGRVNKVRSGRGYGHVLVLGLYVSNNLLA